MQGDEFRALRAGDAPRPGRPGAGSAEGVPDVGSTRGWSGSARRATAALLRRYSSTAVLVALALAGCGQEGQTVDGPVPVGTQVGQRAPELAGRDSSGAAMSLDAESGRAVVVFFQGADCGLCREQLGRLQVHLPAYRHLHTRVIAATPADPREVGDLARSLGLGFPVVSVDSATLVRWDVVGQGAGPFRPGSFVVRDGEIVFRHVGLNASDRATDAALLTVLELLESD